LDKLKKIACLIIILLFVLLFSACGREVKLIPTETILENGETGTLANNNAVDFYFYYPENWIIDKNDAMINIYINDAVIIESDIKEPGTNENLAYMFKPSLSATVYYLPEGKYSNVDEYWRDLGIPSFEKIFQDIKKEADEELKIDGVSAKKYSFTCSLSGMEYKISQIILINKSKVYTLTYTSTEKNYDKYLNILDTAAETFKFK
jgi:hypothetical protein